MGSGLYLIVMVGVIMALAAVLLPAMALKKCDECGRWNIVDAVSCRRCNQAFPEE